MVILLHCFTSWCSGRVMHRLGSNPVLPFDRRAFCHGASGGHRALHGASMAVPASRIEVSKWIFVHLKLFWICSGSLHKRLAGGEVSKRIFVYETRTPKANCLFWNWEIQHYAKTACPPETHTKPFLHELGKVVAMNFRQNSQIKYFYSNNNNNNSQLTNGMRSTPLEYYRSNSLVPMFSGRLTNQIRFGFTPIGDPIKHVSDAE